MSKKTSQRFDFLNSFDKEIEKIDGLSSSSEPPRYWYSFGNYVCNKIMSGSFKQGIPQGRITNLAGPSGAGKSFIAANLVAASQKAGAFCLIIDSENALDDDFMEKIGVDTNTDYKYIGVNTIPQVTKVVSAFLKGYKNDFGTSKDGPPVLILLDSLDMLMTETEVAHYDKGDSKGDQGQRNKQLKAMLRTFVQDIKQLNVMFVCTSQVYKNQDVTNGEGVWIVSDAVKYSCSQIVLITKLKLKSDDKKSTTGVRMICEGYKTRFTLPFQKVTMEVPYETGMDPSSGLLEVAVKLGAVDKRGSRYAMAGSTTTWYEKDMEPYIEEIIEACEKLGSDSRLSLVDDNFEIDMDVETKEEAEARRQKAVEAEHLKQKKLAEEAEATA